MTVIAIVIVLQSSQYNTHNRHDTSISIVFLSLLSLQSSKKGIPIIIVIAIVVALLVSFSLPRKGKRGTSTAAETTTRRCYCSSGSYWTEGAIQAGRAIKKWKVLRMHSLFFYGAPTHVKVQYFYSDGFVIFTRFVGGLFCLRVWILYWRLCMSEEKFYIVAERYSTGDRSGLSWG